MSVLGNLSGNDQLQAIKTFPGKSHVISGSSAPTYIGCMHRVQHF